MEKTWRIVLLCLMFGFSGDIFNEIKEPFPFFKYIDWNSCKYKTLTFEWSRHYALCSQGCQSHGESSTQVQICLNFGTGSDRVMQKTALQVTSHHSRKGVCKLCLNWEGVYRLGNKGLNSAGMDTSTHIWGFRYGTQNIWFRNLASINLFIVNVIVKMLSSNIIYEETSKSSQKNTFSFNFIFPWNLETCCMLVYVNICNIYKYNSQSLAIHDIYLWASIEFHDFL